MIKIIIFQHNEKGYMRHAVKRTIKNNNEDEEYDIAIQELQDLRKKSHEPLYDTTLCAKLKRDVIKIEKEVIKND